MQMYVSLHLFVFLEPFLFLFVCSVCSILVCLFLIYLIINVVIIMLLLMPVHIIVR